MKEKDHWFHDIFIHSFDLTYRLSLPAHSAVMSSSLLLLLFFVSAWTLEFRYHSNREIEQYLRQVYASNPDIVHLYSIGKSVRGNSAPTACSYLSHL